MTQVASTPRFALGQTVKVISNHGGLYAAQIGVVGVISKMRKECSEGYPRYDVTYAKPFSLPNEKGRERIVIVREDDLEPVERIADEPPTAAIPEQPERPEQLADAPVAEVALFRIGQRVTVHPPADGVEDEYPSFTRYPVVGEIVSACQVTQAGVHCYDVRFPRIERGVSTDSWPPVSIREAHLQPEPWKPGWLAPSATGTPKAERLITPQPEPKFAIGEHVTVHPHSALCYATFTRKGAVGVIVEVGKPIRGIRRYEVHFPAKGSRPGEFILPSRIREEHLVKAEAPTPAPVASEPSHDDGWGTWDDDAPLKAKEREDDATYTAAYGDELEPAEPQHPKARARHAYEYRDEHSKNEHLWCDAGGCFIEACAVCRAMVGDALRVTTPATPTASSASPTCTRGRSHDWQVWGADSRYRLCRTCKRAERVAQEVAQ